MSAPYTGNPIAVESPATAPGPGVAPIVDLPADTDGATWANLYQACKTLADYIAYDQDILNGQPAYNNQASAAFSSGSLLSQIALKDPGGVPKSSFDYLGYPLGNRLFTLEENWVGTASAVTTGALGTFGRWQVATSGSGVGVSVVQPQSFYPTPMIAMNVGSSNGAYSCAYTAVQVVAPNTNQMVALEFDAYLDNFSGSWTVAMGLDAGVPFLSTTKGVLAYAASGATTAWQSRNGNGSSVHTDTSSTAYALATVTTCRIEIHGSGSPFGACTRLFIGGALVDTYNGAALVQTNGTALLYLALLAMSGDTTAGRFFYVGGVKCCVNRFTTVGV